MDCVKDLPVDVSSKIVSYKIGDPKYLSGIKGNTKGRDGPSSCRDLSGEGLSPVFQERAPWSIMDETNKAREHKKA